MQAILKNKYIRFCDWLQDVKRKQAIRDEKLDVMEEEIVHMYFAYLQKIEEVRVIVEAYERKQKEIRNRIKARQRKAFEVDGNLITVEMVKTPEKAGL